MANLSFYEGSYKEEIVLEYIKQEHSLGNKVAILEVVPTLKDSIKIGKKDKIRKKIDESYNVLIVKDAEFLTNNQVGELFYLTKVYHVKVICFGLKMDINHLSFLIDKKEKIKTTCHCGKKAKKYVFMKDGQITNEYEEDTKIVSLCGNCYLKEVIKKC